MHRIHLLVHALLVLMLSEPVRAAPPQDAPSPKTRSATARNAPGDIAHTRGAAHDALTASLAHSMKISPRLDLPKRNLASELVMNAMGYLDTPFLYGGNTVDTGFDCSGFVRAVYRKSLGTLLPRRARDQAAATREIDAADLKPGDLVFFQTLDHPFSHVGIYIGDSRFIHAPQTGEFVRVEDMSDRFWQERLSGARRVIPSERED